METALIPAGHAKQDLVTKIPSPTSRVRIQTYKRLKRTLFIMTKNKTKTKKLILGVSPLSQAIIHI